MLEESLAVVDKLLLRWDKTPQKLLFPSTDVLNGKWSVIFSSMEHIFPFILLEFRQQKGLSMLQFSSVKKAFS